MKPEQTLALAVGLAASLHSAASQPHTPVVVGQPAVGRVVSGRTTAVLGLPAPMHVVAQRQPPTATDDRVPDILGSEIRWRSYALDGRMTGEGLLRFDERGGRRLLLNPDETGGRGPRIIICQSTQGRSRWRRLVWVR